MFLLAKFFELVSYKLNLCSDDYLNGSLSRTDNSCNTCRFDLLLINLCVIFDYKTKSCDTVVDRLYVIFSTNTLKNDLSYCCEVIVCKNNFCFIIIVIFTTWCLQIEFNDCETEYNVEYDESCDSKRNDKPCLSCCRKGSREDKVCKSC